MEKICHAFAESLVGFLAYRIIHDEFFDVKKPKYFVFFIESMRFLYLKKAALLKTQQSLRDKGFCGIWFG